MFNEFGACLVTTDTKGNGDKWGNPGGDWRRLANNDNNHNQHRGNSGRSHEYNSGEWSRPSSHGNNNLPLDSILHNLDMVKQKINSRSHEVIDLDEIENSPWHRAKRAWARNAEN